MFYPGIFNHGAPGLTPEQTLQAEAAAMLLFVQADRGYLRQASREGLVSGLAHELIFTDQFGAEDVDALIELFAANADTLAAFAEKVSTTEPYVHWYWLQ